MNKLLFLSSFIALLFSILIAALSSYWWLLVEPPSLPLEEVKELARNYYDISATEGNLHGSYDGYVDQPLVGKVVIVTGATSGVGESFAYNMYKMGATVVVASRNERKVDKVVSNFKLDYPFSEGKLYAKGLDISDLESVYNFSTWVKDTFAELHILINNAGIRYSSDGEVPTVDTPLRSKQGYDLLFATNYLGHFLLTDMLLPLLRSTRGARILQVSSNAMFLPATADDLDTLGGVRRPLAAQPLPVARVRPANMDHEERFGTAYGVSKMAQVMHSIELQKELDSDQTTDLKVFSYTPGVTYTGFFPDNIPPLAKNILRRLLYSAEASTYAAFTGLFSRQIRGGDEFWSNSPAFFKTTDFGRWLVDRIQGGSKPAAGLFLFLSVVYQQLHYGKIAVSPVHKACEDTALTQGLYKWSHAEVHNYSFGTSSNDDNDRDDFVDIKSHSEHNDNVPVPETPM